MFDTSVFGNCLREFLQETDAGLGTRLFTTSELDHGLDLVAPLEERDRVLELRFVIVDVNLQTEADLFEDRLHLVAARFLRFLSGFVFEFPVVHNLDHRRLRLRSYFDKIKVCFACKTLCHLERDDANLFSYRPNESDLGNADALINSRFCDVDLLVFC